MTGKEAPAGRSLAAHLLSHHERAQRKRARGIFNTAPNPRASPRGWDEGFSARTCPAPGFLFSPPHLASRDRASKPPFRSVFISFHRPPTPCGPPAAHARSWARRPSRCAARAAAAPSVASAVFAPRLGGPLSAARAAAFGDLRAPPGGFVEGLHPPPPTLRPPRDARRVRDARVRARRPRRGDTRAHRRTLRELVRDRRQVAALSPEQLIAMASPPVRREMASSCRGESGRLASQHPRGSPASSSPPPSPAAGRVGRRPPPGPGRASRPLTGRPRRREPPGAPTRSRPSPNANACPPTPSPGEAPEASSRARALRRDVTSRRGGGRAPCGTPRRTTTSRSRAG